MGAKKMNPDVTIEIVWVNTWYDPVKEASAAEVMMAQGCDMVAQHTDSPAPLQAAEKAGKLDLVKLLTSITLPPKHS